jgi:hypothetical protein
MFLQIYVHATGLESLYKYVPKEVLPEEYGGYAGPLDVIHGELRNLLLLASHLVRRQTTAFLWVGM